MSNTPPVTTELFLTSAAGSEIDLQLDESVKNIERIEVLEAEVPLTFDPFKGCLLQWREAPDRAYVASLEGAPQNSNDFADALAARMEAASGSAFTCTHANGLYTVTCESGPLFDVSASFFYDTDMLRLQPRGADLSVFTARPLLWGPPTLFLRSNLASLLTARSVITNRHTAGSDVLARVQLRQPHGDIVLYSDQSPTAHAVVNQANVGSVRAWLTFPDDTVPLDLNGRPFSLRLRLASKLNVSRTQSVWQW